MNFCTNRKQNLTIFCNFASAMKKLLLATLLAVATLGATAQDDAPAAPRLPWPQNLCARLDSIVDTPLLETSQLGLMVYDLTADSALYTHGHRQQLRPASTQKLLTAVTAIGTLGTDYQLKTQLYHTGNIVGGTLRGDIHVVGGMDPMFDRADMQAFVSRLRHIGIDTIRGHIVADLSFKDDKLLGEGWCWDDDNAPLTPLLFEGRDGFTARLAQDLQRDGVAIVATTVTTLATQRRYITSRAHTLADLLPQMMKESDNLYAEAVFYHLGRSDDQRQPRPATARTAASRVRQTIQRAGLQPGEYRVADGSGLSLYNYVTAEMLALVLRHAYRSRTIYSQLYPTLPVAGVDGTLKNRMKNTPAEGNVHAKTGSVTAVSSLAGYCTAANGHQLCFAIINQGIARMSDGRTMQDQICEALCRTY